MRDNSGHMVLQRQKYCAGRHRDLTSQGRRAWVKMCEHLQLLPHPKPLLGYLVQVGMVATPEGDWKSLFCLLTIVCVLACKSGVLPDFFRGVIVSLFYWEPVSHCFQKDSVLTSLEPQVLMSRNDWRSLSLFC